LYSDASNTSKLNSWKFCGNHEMIAILISAVLYSAVIPKV
jgi:hypothetical protein